MRRFLPFAHIIILALLFYALFGDWNANMRFGLSMLTLGLTSVLALFFPETQRFLDRLWGRDWESPTERELRIQQSARVIGILGGGALAILGILLIAVGAGVRIPLG